MKTIVRAYSVICLIVLLCLNSSGQVLTGKIKGQVIDKQSMIGLPGVNVVIYSKEKKYGTATDSIGNYSIGNIPVGRFSIEYRLIGYENVEMQNILLTSARDLFVNAEMQEGVKKIDEVVIKARTKDQVINDFSVASARSFTVEETNKYAGSWGDPARMASNFAGVISAGDQRNDIIIRGNSPIGLLWRLDGIEIPNPNHFGTFGTTGGPICILNNNQLTNSDFFTGAYPSEFGNSLSGVFDLKMKNGNNEKHEFMGGMGFNGFELGAEGPVCRTTGSSYMINFRYSMMDLMSAMGMFDVGGVPKYADFSFKILLPTKKAGTFSVIGLGGKSQIKLEDDQSGEVSSSGWTSEKLSGTNVKSGSDMGVIGLLHKYLISKKARIETAVSATYSGSNNDVDSIGETGIFNFYNEDYVETAYSISSKYTLKFDPGNTLQVGVNAKLSDFKLFDETNYSPSDEYVKGADYSGSAALYQAFFQMKNRLSEKITIKWGLHGQYFSLNNSKMIEPRLGINYKLNGKQNLNLAYGLHGQTQPLLLYFVQTKDTESHLLTNKSLEFSKGHHLVAGYDLSITKNLRFKLETYYQYLYDIPVEKKPSVFSMLNYGASFHNENNDSLINNGLGKNFGIELTLEKYLSKNFYYLLTASVFDSKYSGSDMVWRNNAFNGNYSFNFLTGYEIPIKNDLLSINLKVVYAGGKRYIPVDLERSKESGYAVYDYERAYSEKFNDYFRTDLRIAYRMNSKKISQEWTFDVQNLTNHKNIFTQKYNSASKEIVDILQLEFFPIGSWKIFF